MPVPQFCLDLLLSDLEPGEAYRQCLEWVEAENPAEAKQLTQDVVYGCEVRYALEVLREGRPERLYNFGDLDGRGTPLLWKVLDPLPDRKVAFVGAGPYPVTAFLVKERFPDSELCCLDNHLVSFLLGRAVCERMAPELEYQFGDAHQFNYQPFDAVVVAAMVNQREKLARQILETSDAQLLVRGDLEFTHPRLHTVSSTFDSEGQLAF